MGHHSCQVVEYCPWNVFRQQISHVLQSTKLVERDETDLVQLWNPHRLHFQVFRSAPWSKPLHNGFGAAAVRPEFKFERSCSLVFQQVISRATIQCNSDSSEDSDTVACVTDQCGTVKHGPIANIPPDVEHLVFGSPAQSTSTVTWMTSFSQLW